MSNFVQREPYFSPPFSHISPPTDLICVIFIWIVYNKKRISLQQKWGKTEQYLARCPISLRENQHRVSDQITVTAKYKIQHIYWWLRLRTKKGLQGGKTIQQRSEFFASLVPNASTSSLACALALFAHMYLCLLSLAWLLLLRGLQG